MKTGKEIKINNFEDYNIVVGSVNNKKPKAIYLNISAWSEPLKEYDVDYTREIKNLNKKIKQTLFNYFNNNNKTNFTKNNTIVDLDIRESGVRYGKRSFMNCEITLFLNEEMSINSEEMKENFNSLIPMLVKSVFEKDKTFKFHRRKV
jgi:hypothetical protein